MKELIDKSEIVEEIERKIKQFKNERNTIIKNTDNLKELSSRIIMCQEIISFLDTLEVEEVDLEKEYKEFIDCDNGRSMFETAKYFFELGLKTQKGE